MNSADDFFGGSRQWRFADTSRLFALLFDVPIAALAVAGEDTLWFPSFEGIGVTSVPRPGSFAQAAFELGGPIVVEDARADARFAGHPLVVGPSGLRFFAAAPFKSPLDEQLGIFFIADTEPRSFSPLQLEQLRGASSWVESVIADTKELIDAAVVQRSTLPPNSQSFAGFEIAGCSVMSKAIGGDFYDWYATENGMAVTLTDVMGKGAGPGIIAATIRTVMRGAAKRNNPATAVRRAAHWLDSQFRGISAIATLFHARLDAATGGVDYVDAGHGLSLVVRADGTSIRFNEPDFPLGTLLDTTWRRRRATLGEGDTLVILSDGILDLFDGSLAAVERVQELASHSTSVQELVDAVEQLALESTAVDDVSIVAVRRKPPTTATEERT